MAELSIVPSRLQNKIEQKIKMYLARPNSLASCPSHLLMYRAWLSRNTCANEKQRPTRVTKLFVNLRNDRPARLVAGAPDARYILTPINLQSFKLYGIW